MYLSVAALIVLGVAIVLALGWYLTPRGRYQPLAPAARFPPSPTPYFLTTGDTHLIIVNTGAEFLVFDRRSTRPNCTANVHWDTQAATRGQPSYFADPCHGARYTLTGENIVGVGPPARGLDRYAYQIERGEVWVCLVCLTPGVLPPSQ